MLPVHSWVSGHPLELSLSGATSLGKTSSFSPGSRKLLPSVQPGDGSLRCSTLTLGFCLSRVCLVFMHANSTTVSSYVFLPSQVQKLLLCCSHPLSLALTCFPPSLLRWLNWEGEVWYRCPTEGWALKCLLFSELERCGFLCYLTSTAKEACLMRIERCTTNLWV